MARLGGKRQTNTHTYVGGLVFGEIKAWQKVPGFMLIFIKIILTCNVASAAAEQKVKETAAYRKKETGLYTHECGQATNF